MIENKFKRNMAMCFTNLYLNQVDNFAFFPKTSKTIQNKTVKKLSIPITIFQNVKIEL